MSGAKVSLGSGITVNSLSLLSAYQLQVNVTVSSSATLGSRTISITDPTSGATTGTCTTCFSVSDTPVVAPYYKWSMPQGASNQTLYLFGSNFMPGATVAIGSSTSGVTVNSVTYDSPTSMQVVLTTSSSTPVGISVPDRHQPSERVDLDAPRIV